MATQRAQTDRSKQIKVWTLMTATLFVGLLLAFGRWAGHDDTLFGFVGVIWGYLPAGWVLAIEYGMLVFMVAVVIQSDRVAALVSQAESLTWLGGIGLFTAGLYHDGYLTSNDWAASVGGYGTFTRFLLDPSLVRLPLLLSVWPMAYSLIVVFTSFAAIMGWQRLLFRWRWILHAAFLLALTNSWIIFVFWLANSGGESLWLAGSVVVFPVIVLVIILVRDGDRKLCWLNLAAAAWLATALIPGLIDGVNMSHVRHANWMNIIFHPLILGDLFLTAGAAARLLKSGSPVIGSNALRPNLVDMPTVEP